MVDLQIFGLFMGFWASLYLMDVLLRSVLPTAGYRPPSNCATNVVINFEGWDMNSPLYPTLMMSHPKTETWYCRLMDGNGVNISLGQVRWFTPRFNRLFMRLGQISPWISKVWFSIGVLFGLIAQVASLYLLTYIVYQTLKPEAEAAVREERVLTPVMPGVNLPTNQLGYYLMTLFVCGVLHEAGHAIAAVIEQVKVNGFGVFFLVLYPGAFVDLHVEHLHSISPIRQLRIYCAGIWHNFIIVVAALGTLIALPHLLVPVYRTGAGAVVTHVVKDSPVYGPRGLQPGDLITRVDTCYVVNAQTWLGCVHKAYSLSQIGFCMTREQIRLHDTALKHEQKSADPVECCDRFTNSHVCFRIFGRALTKNYACLPARQVTASRSYCVSAAQCPLAQACVIPSLDNSTRLVKVLHGSKDPLLFLGHSMDLLYSVQTSDYSPRWPVLPLNLPYIVQTFCRYLVSLSGALVILNVVPCYALDGQWILRAFIEIALARVATRDTRLNVFTVVLLYGTIILVSNIIIAMWTLFR